MIRRLVAIFIALIGVVLLVFPYTAGKEAYFVKDTFYINVVDSVDLGYEPFVKLAIQKDRNLLAFEEKKQLRDKSKKKGVELDKAAVNAQAKNDMLLLEKINVEKNSFSFELMQKETEIDEKYNIDNIPAAEFAKLFSEALKKVSKDDYLVAVANEMVNPTQNEKIKPIVRADISVQKVNLQDKSPFVLSGLLLLGSGIYLFFFLIGMVKLQNPIVKYSSIIIFTVLCIVMSAKIYYSIANRIEFDATLAQREKEVKAKLMDIRSLEMTYFEEKRKYCNNFKDLINFAKNDSVQIVKYLVNKDDTAAVNLALKKGLPLEEKAYVSALEKALNNKKINIDELANVPFTTDNFEINAGVIDKNGRDVHVFEVKTSKFAFVKELKTLPANFDKSKYLILGSMLEPTTEGNW